MAKFDKDTALAALLYLTRKAGGSIDLYKLVKLMYFADKKHLHKWGVTITNDTFVRMDNGSTGSKTYDIIKAARGDARQSKSRKDFYKKFFLIEGKPCNTVKAIDTPDMQVLSKAEIKTLDEIFSEHGHKSFPQLKKEAHDAAYNKSDSFYMTYEDIAEDNEDLLDQLRIEKESV